MKIVVIDDEELIGFIIESYLSPLAGEVIKFVNINSAYDYLINNKVDLLISDFYMPEGSGLELIQKLRNEGWETPAILMSGSHVPLSEKNQFTAFIKKPVNMEELLKMARGLIKS